MRKVSLLAAVPILLVMAVATSRCNPMDVGIDKDDRSTQPARLQPAAQKALAAVSTVHDHQMLERGGERVVYHPGWSRRIEVVNAAGERSEIYRQTRPYNGSHPSEVVLGFRDVALAAFDPGHRIRGITVHTDGQDWSFSDIALCPPVCGEGPVSPPTPSLAPIVPCPPHCPTDGTPPPPTPSLAPAALPLDHARLALAPAERARASVSTGPEHRMASAAGERVTYHPGWSSRIAKVDAAGRRREIYRQSAPYRGAHPGEVVVGFGDVALAVFDPNHRIAGITVETVDRQVWSLDERVWICTQDCPPPAEGGPADP